MKKIILFLLGLLVLTGCSTEDESSMASPPDVSTEISVGATRVLPDSIAIALDNSILLQDLTAYNDSIIAGTIQTRFSWGWLKKLVKIAKADLYGLGGGFLLGTGLTSSPIVGGLLGVVSGVGFSAAAAMEATPSQIQKKMPTTFSLQFNAFDRYVGIMRADVDFNTKYSNELLSIGDISAYGSFQDYFTFAVQHNLALKEFRDGADYSDLSQNCNAIPTEYRNLIYSNNIMSMLEQDKLDALEGNLNWGYIFSDRVNMTMTISQAKAAAIASRFEDLIDNAEPSLSVVKDYTLVYMRMVKNSPEIEQSEKILLLNTLPVYMYSLSYWSRSLVEE